MDTMTKADEREAVATSRFFERVMEGCGPINAAIEVGWTPAQLRVRMEDHDFAELVDIARERLLESVEEAVVVKAREGVRWAAQMVLYNARSERWKDVRHIKMERSGDLDPTIVSSVRQAMIEVLRGDATTIAAMQPQPKAIEVTARDVDPG